MIISNQKKVEEKKIKNKIGGDANESRFGGLTKELRSHKLIICPSINTKGIVKFEQGWNKLAKKKDVVRVTIGNQSLICERTFLEQSLATMAQGDEVLKYTAPVVGGVSGKLF